MDQDPVVILLCVGLVAGLVLTMVAVVKTARFHGLGRQRWAPPAVPWFIAGRGIGVLTLAGGLLWAMS